MNQIVVGRINDFLQRNFKYHQKECDAIVWKMSSLAQASGYDLGERFARAGLAAGPEARIASSIVDSALMGGGTDSSEYSIRQTVANWLRQSGK